MKKKTTDMRYQVESFELVGEPEPKFWVFPDAGCC